MTKEQAIKIIWDYMHLNHELKKADIILVLGSHDTSVVEYAADLYLQGWAPLLVLSGSGDIHNHEPGREQFIGSTEAEVFAEIAKKRGVPSESILVENESQNTGHNFVYSRNLLKENDIEPETAIIVQKPYMERRVYATGKVRWPEVELIVTSPPVSENEYGDSIGDQEERWVHTMVGDLQRLKEYPKKGFMIKQEIPEDVWQAYEFLVEKGFDERLI